MSSFRFIEVFLTATSAAASVHLIFKEKKKMFFKVYNFLPPSKHRNSNYPSHYAVVTARSNVVIGKLRRDFQITKLHALKSLDNAQQWTV